MEQPIRASGRVPRHSRWTRWRIAAHRKFGFLWQPLLFAGLVGGFFLGRALPGSLIAPFGIAYVAAVRGAGFRTPHGLAVTGAVSAGAATILAWPQLMWVIAAMLAAQALSSALRIGAQGPSPLSAAAIAALVTAVPAAMQSAPLPPATLVFWCGLSGVLTLVFCLGVMDIASGRVFHTETLDWPVPTIVMLACAFSGLEGIRLWDWLVLRDVAAGLMIMACGLAGGPSLGAAAGAVTGISLLFTAVGVQGAGPLPEAHSMAYVVAGLVSGTFRELQKVGVSVAYLLGLVTYFLIPLRGSPELLAVSYTAALASGLFLLVPRRWLAVVPAAFSSGSRPDPSVPRTAVAEPEGVLDKVRGVTRALREVSRTFDQIATVEAPNVEEGVGRVVAAVSDQVCQACSLYRDCWERDYQQTRDLFRGLWTQRDGEGPLPSDPPPAALEQLCVRPSEVALAVNYWYDLKRNHRHWENRLQDGRTMAGGYVKNVARLLDRVTEEADPEHGREERPAVFQVRTGVARLPKRGGGMSGDSYVTATIRSDQYLMALSDGMGGGRGAALESRQCVNLLKELLGAGFSSDLAINTVNSALLLRSPEDSFATVDLTVIDLATGRAEFVKIGAAPSFLKRGEDVTVVKQPSVPVGIINHIQVEPDFRTLRDGDVIVMITDGIWDVSKDDLDKERWLLEHLSKERASDPEAIAEGILARAVELVPGSGDDMTALVAVVQTVREAAKVEQAPRPATSVWAPARLAPRSTGGNKK